MGATREENIITALNYRKEDATVYSTEGPPCMMAGYYDLKGKKNYGAIKRGMDILLSSLLIISVLSWVYPLLALLIRIGSKGGTLFIQKRIGRNGRVFNCYKFRTMFLNDMADRMETEAGDKRITRLGWWLRLSYIDELPQLINVLMGDMTIIGPRPHMLEHHYRFCKEVPGYNFRHVVKPGITGLSQVKGYHGSIVEPYNIIGRTRLDLFYVRQISLRLDLMILFKTVSIIFSSRKK
jgi:putative colanic acid biosynthesis UDP-glucose lipid carrier transferase